MCHSDLHACNGDWGINAYPIAPGHEIAGIVQKVGSNVTKFKVGDEVAVGCFVESCGSCYLCQNGDQNYCRSAIQTYGSKYVTGKGHDECAGHHTNGGYTSQITVLQNFVYKVPENIPLESVGPLLCAGITMFSPLNRHVLKKPGKKTVGIIGFGGLGQMGVKIAKAMGADVICLSRSLSKQEEAKSLGAEILAHTNVEAMKNASYTLDVILDTVSVAHDVSKFLPLLKVGGTYVFIGGVTEPAGVVPLALIASNLKFEGSMVGGIPETQEMLDFCSKHDIKPEIKMICAEEANEQFQALAKGTASVQRAVIDMSTLPDLQKNKLSQ
jgi:uncharacterized zinc-type alcohol dehydrogenase-like protein